MISKRERILAFAQVIVINLCVFHFSEFIAAPKPQKGPQKKVSQPKKSPQKSALQQKSKATTTKKATTQKSGTKASAKGAQSGFEKFIYAYSLANLEGQEDPEALAQKYLTPEEWAELKQLTPEDEEAEESGGSGQDDEESGEEQEKNSDKEGAENENDESEKNEDAE